MDHLYTFVTQQHTIIGKGSKSEANSSDLQEKLVIIPYLYSPIFTLRKTYRR